LQDNEIIRAEGFFNRLPQTSIQKPLNFTIHDRAIHPYICAANKVEELKINL
jgi:hypothetical protein